jgi:hypothetical protein
MSNLAFAASEDEGELLDAHDTLRREFPNSTAARSFVRRHNWIASGRVVRTDADARRSGRIGTMTEPPERRLELIKNISQTGGQSNRVHYDSYVNRTGQSQAKQHPSPSERRRREGETNWAIEADAREPLHFALLWPA